MKKIRVAGFFAVLAVSIVFPLFFPDTSVTTTIVFTFIMMAAATGWNLFSGSTRYISLGHAAFYGLGAYILAVICQVWHVQGGSAPLLLLPLVGLMTGLCSLPLGWVALHTRRYTFMVITIAIFSLMYVLLPNLLNRIIPQSSEIYLPNPPWNGVIFNLPFYYTALLLLLCALAVSQWVRSSNFGLRLFAIGDDEDRALALGNNTSLYKLVAWGVSAVFVGMAGALNAYYFGSIDPTSAFARTINIALPVTAFIGGIGTLMGPLLGAIITVPLQQYLTVQYSNVQGLDLILYGVLLLVIVLVLPKGIGPLIQKRLLMGMSFSKKSSPVSALELATFPGTPVFVSPSGVSYEMIRESEVRSPLLEPIDGSISRSNSVPLSLRRGYSAMKSSRLVPLAQEMVTDGPPNPSSGNGV